MCRSMMKWQYLGEGVLILDSFYSSSPYHRSGILNNATRETFQCWSSQLMSLPCIEDNDLQHGLVLWQIGITAVFLTIDRKSVV